MKDERTPQEVHREYFLAAQQLGDKAFLLKNIPQEIEALHKKMGKLMIESRELHDKEAAFQKKLAEKQAAQKAIEDAEKERLEKEVKKDLEEKEITKTLQNVKDAHDKMVS